MSILKTTKVIEIIQITLKIVFGLIRFYVIKV